MAHRTDYPQHALERDCDCLSGVTGFPEFPTHLSGTVSVGLRRFYGGLDPTGIPHFFYSLPRVDDPTCAIYYHLIVLVCARKDGVYKQGYRFRRLTLLQASIHIFASFFLSYSISTTIQTSTLGQPSRFLNGGCYERAWTSQVKIQLF